MAGRPAELVFSRQWREKEEGDGRIGEARESERERIVLRRWTLRLLYREACGGSGGESAGAARPDTARLPVNANLAVDR
jgi:hypothetical protein